jgi:hypothetical protein
MKKSVFILLLFEVDLAAVGVGRFGSAVDFSCRCIWLRDWLLASNSAQALTFPPVIWLAAAWFFFCQVFGLQPQFFLVLFLLGDLPLFLFSAVQIWLGLHVPQLVGSRSPVLLHPKCFSFCRFSLLLAPFSCASTQSAPPFPAASLWFPLVLLVPVQAQCQCALGFRLLRVSGCCACPRDFVAGLIPFLLLAFLPALLPVRGQVPVSAKVDAFLVLDLSVRSTPPPEFSFFGCHLRFCWGARCARPGLCQHVCRSGFGCLCDAPVHQLWFSCFGEDYCKWKPVSLLSHQIKRLEFFYCLLCSCGRYSVTHTKCLVKYVWGLELLISLILVAIVSHVTLLTSSVIFCYDYMLSNSVLRVNSFSIAMRSWPS